MIKNNVWRKQKPCSFASVNLGNGDIFCPHFFNIQIKYTWKPWNIRGPWLLVCLDPLMIGACCLMTSVRRGEIVRNPLLLL